MPPGRVGCIHDLIILVRLELAFFCCESLQFLLLLGVGIAKLKRRSHLAFANRLVVESINDLLANVRIPEAGSRVSKAGTAGTASQRTVQTQHRD